LPGGAGVTNPYGRADIRIQVDANGELYIISKSDGMIRYITEAFGEGDFDFDGDVDGRDFLVWQRGGSPDPLSAEDLAVWQANYADAALNTASAAVPEPATSVICLLVLLVAGRNQR
jgi:hypothetical protein